MLRGCAIAHEVSRRLLTVEVLVHSQASPCGIRDGQRGNGTGFPQSPSILPCQYHSTATPYSLILSGGWEMGPLLVHFHTVLPHRNIKRRWMRNRLYFPWQKNLLPNWTDTADLSKRQASKLNWASYETGQRHFVTLFQTKFNRPAKTYEILLYF
jgi:hypothetical protein